MRNAETATMKFRKPIFPTTDEVNAMTLDQCVEDIKRFYIVKHPDGYEQRLHWRTTDESKATRFKCYADAIDYAEKKSIILQSY